ncbi:MAG: metallophosphoesterase [Symploca sp. SIO2D2]|nr:metallophosphoesterase [Symploca sp. SIO2D2]
MIPALFFSIIGAGHLYIFHVAASAFPRFSIPIGLIVAAFFLCLILSIVFEKRGQLKLSLPFSYIGYAWLGFAYLWFNSAIFLDLLSLVIPSLDPRDQFYWSLFPALALALIGYAGARRTRVVKVELSSPKLPSEGLRVLQISDLHLGDGSSLSHVKRIIRRIEELKPDLIVSTGDLFDGYLQMMGPYIEALRELRAPLGKFAVSGNHEVYAGLEPALERTEEAGFVLLRNRSENISDHLTVAGIDDPASYDAESYARAEESTFENVSENRYTVFLNHRPSLHENTFKHFDLQLSGHTHGGQIFPFILLTKLAYKAKVGLSLIAPQTYLYLSRGTGSWGPQLRLFAPTEITLFELSSSDSKS